MRNRRIAKENDIAPKRAKVQTDWYTVTASVYGSRAAFVSDCRDNPETMLRVMRFMASGMKASTHAMYRRCQIPLPPIEEMAKAKGGPVPITTNWSSTFVKPTNAFLKSDHYGKKG